jgi:hypothetical protein
MGASVRPAGTLTRLPPAALSALARLRTPGPAPPLPPREPAQRAYQEDHAQSRGWLMGDADARASIYPVPCVRSISAPTRSRPRARHAPVPVGTGSRRLMAAQAVVAGGIKQNAYITSEKRGAMRDSAVPPLGLDPCQSKQSHTPNPSPWTGNHLIGARRIH